MKKRIALGLAALMTVCSMMGCGSSSSSNSAAPAGGADAAESGAAAQAADVAAAALPKNITVQVPAKAGGGTDVMARALTQQITADTGSNMTVVNNMDGNGVVAMETVRSAKGDGSTILQYHTSMLIATATGVYDHDILDDFTVIGIAQGTEKGQYCLVTNGESDLDTLDKFIEYGKNNEVKIGVQTGGSMHIVSGLMAKATGIQAKFVEAGSDTEKLTALVGNTIDACIVNVNQAAQYVESGKAHGLAVVTNGEEGAKSTVLPDIPSFDELGYDVNFTTLTIIAGPKDMDAGVAKGLYDAFAAAAQADAVNEVLEPAGMAMVFYDQEEGIKQLEAQKEMINSLVDELGLAQ